MNGSPRVVLLVENLPIARDHRLRKQAAALVASGIAVTVICRRDPENALVPGITLREYRAPVDALSKFGYLREYGWSLLMAAWQILRCLFAEGFDVLQVASTPDIYFFITVPMRLLGKVVVFDARDLSPEIYARRYGRDGGVVLTVLRALERASYRSCDHVLAVNDSVSAIAQQRGRVPAAQVTVVGNGPVLGDVRSAGPRQGTSASGGLTCCWIGLMGPQDGVDLGLRAVAHLVHARHRTDTQFVFAGTGDALPDLQALTRELRIEEWVSFPGWLDSDGVVALLQKADVGLEPNLEDFVSPVKVMEYMVYGLPTVAFDLRETRKIVGPAALFAPPGDIEAFAGCLETLLSDASARLRLGALGRARIENTFSWEHQERHYLELYHTILGPHRPDLTLELA
jgi:glycosyltransferase involved in cell wall biosynthesis